MKFAFRLVPILVFAAFAAPLTMDAQQAPSAPMSTATAGRELPKPNYDLAFRWTSTKVGKYVFSTSVAPHWLEFSDRFWYQYETPAGMKWWMVDPIKKTKTPLFENAKLASQLTRILRTPYDSEHLPVNQIRFFDNDTKIRFSVSLPRESRVVTSSGAEMDGMTLTEAERRQQQQGGRGGGGGGRGGGQGRGGAAGTTTPAGNKTWWLEYDIATANVVLNEKYEPEPATPNWAQVSPDKQTVIFARGQNLFMMDGKNYLVAQKTPNDPSVAETQLTTDGVEYYGYAPAQMGGQDDDDDQQQGGGGRGGQTGQGANAQTHENDKKFGPRRRSIGIMWSQDSKKFSLQRSDSRKVGDLWVINSLANPRPRLETYKYGMPGEANQPQAELQVFDVSSRKPLKLMTESFKDQNLGSTSLPLTNLQREKGDTTPRWLSPTGDKLFYTRLSRDQKRFDIVEGDTLTGEARIVIGERLNTYIESQPMRLITNPTGGGKEIIHWSERDGWGHYYLYDTRGKVIRQLTQGEFVNTGVVSVDEKGRALYVHAVGREKGEDPYYQHLYRVNLDTGDMKLVTPGNGTHTSSMNDKSTFVVDNWSRIDMAPESVLYDSLGNKVMDLEKTDVSALLAAGFKYPEAFTVKADDGVTDLYGVMYKPFDFDPAKRYPIIEYVYPGPQTESVTKTFSPRQANVMLAQFGFIVIEVGNRGGNPQRSKWYHNFGYGNLRDYGLADKKAAVEQLAKRHPWIDPNLVGIYGHSGGGFMSTAAMFVYPDFFKVAVSTSGNHDNSVYNRAWSEKHDGVKEIEKDGEITFEYDIDKNQDLAKNLKGKLLLMTGDIDNNVHPAGTFRVVDALIRANKRFDFHIIPGKRHGYADAGDWSAAIRADYFCRYLLGWSPTDADIMELQRETAIRR